MAQGTLRDMTSIGQQGSLNFAKMSLPFLTNEVFLLAFIKNSHLDSRQL